MSGFTGSGRGAARRGALAVALALAAGCATRTPVPYRLPRTALVPLEVAGIDDRSGEYGAMFCSVLRHVGDENGPWGACGEYIDSPGRADLDLSDIPVDYRILVIPGFLGQCLSPNLQPFADALPHLRAKHGLTAENLDVPAVGSCEFNAEIIARHLLEQSRADPRRFIVVGYSKGAVDAMTALAAHPEIREAVAALVTVVAPVGGSRLPELTSDTIVRRLRTLSLGHCDPGDGGGVDSVRRPARQAFLREHPEPLVPTYSLVAVSEEKTTSRLLRSYWRKLSVISIDQDALIITSEGIPPGATFLGVLAGDHWAIGIPFERSKDSRVRKIFDHNHFPRTALLEAAIRLVVADLAAARR